MFRIRCSATINRLPATEALPENRGTEGSPPWQRVRQRRRLRGRLDDGAESRRRQNRCGGLGAPDDSRRVCRGPRLPSFGRRGDRPEPVPHPPPAAPPLPPADGEAAHDGPRVDRRRRSGHLPLLRPFDLGRDGAAMTENRTISLSAHRVQRLRRFRWAPAGAPGAASSLVRAPRGSFGRGPHSTTHPAARPPPAARRGRRGARDHRGHRRRRSGPSPSLALSTPVAMAPK